MTSKFASLHSLRHFPGECLSLSANFCQSTLISHSKLKQNKTPRKGKGKKKKREKKQNQSQPTKTNKQNHTTFSNYLTEKLK